MDRGLGQPFKYDHHLVPYKLLHRICETMRTSDICLLLSDGGILRTLDGTVTPNGVKNCFGDPASCTSRGLREAGQCLETGDPVLSSLHEMD